MRVIIIGNVCAQLICELRPTLTHNVYPANPCSRIANKVPFLYNDLSTIGSRMMSLEVMVAESPPTASPPESDSDRN